jgi:hypothetical protein
MEADNENSSFASQCRGALYVRDTAADLATQQWDNPNRA